MKFLWPQLLWLLLAAPLLVAAYLYVLGRRKRAALKFASLITVRAAMTGAAAWRRHVPPAIFLFGVLAILVAIARPSALVTLPSAQRVIILAIDVSLSMRAADVQPNRISAAQAAAKAFVQEVPSDVRIGIVSFAGTALLAQAPTNNREDLVAAIDRLQLDRQTAIGSGIVISLATLFPNDGIDLEPMVLGARSVRGAEKKAAKNTEPKARQPLPPGSNASAAIVLLTDGRRTTGPDPLMAARMAAERGIRVFTVGFGSAQGGHASVEGYSIYMAFDEETLKAIAELTRAEYFHATSAAELTKIYEALSSRLVLQKEHTEITALFVVAAALLLVVGAALSLLWFNRAL
jgi:Ca-activated chloride channel homolog